MQHASSTARFFRASLAALLTAGIFAAPSSAMQAEQNSPTGRYLTVLHGVVDCKHLAKLPKSERLDILYRNMIEIGQQFDRRLRFTLNGYEGVIHYRVVFPWRVYKNGDHKSEELEQHLVYAMKNELCPKGISDGF